MLKSQAFWVGVAAGVILYYIYTTQLKGKGKGGA